MFENLMEAEKHFEEINEMLMDPEVISDNEKYKNLMKEHKNLSPIIEKYREYKTVQNNLEGAKQLIDESGNDPEMREMAEEEYKECKEAIETITDELKILLLPKDEDDDKNVIIEIRAGTGGEEAALFAHSVYRMYSMYADRKGYKIEVMNINETELGGVKEISFMVEGNGAFSRFKFESGVHRHLQLTLQQKLSVTCTLQEMMLKFFLAYLYLLCYMHNHLVNRWKKIAQMSLCKFSFRVQ